MRYRRGAASCGLNRRLLTSRGMSVNRIGKVVVAGICSPSHDCYVEGKVGRLQPYMYASQRARMIELALAGAGENAWVTPGLWEAAQDWFVDFPAVAKHYASCLARHFPKDEITLAFLCGTDHIRKVTQQLQLGMHARHGQTLTRARVEFLGIHWQCRLQNGVSATIPVVGIARKQHELRIHPPVARGRYLFLDDEHALGLSSTEVRTACVFGIAPLLRRL